VQLEAAAQPGSGHLLIKKGKLQYAVERKKVAEGRSDWLIPLLAQAILQAQAAVRAVGKGASPLAIVHAPRVSDSAVESLRRFAEEYAPGVPVGVLAQQGLRSRKSQRHNSVEYREGSCQRETQATALFGIMEDFDVCDTRIFELFVTNASASVVILLIVWRIQWSNDEAQPRAGRNSPRHPVKLKWDFGDLARRKKLTLEVPVAKASATDILAQFDRGTVR
jgi:hypothetical protein